MSRTGGGLTPRLEAPVSWEEGNNAAQLGCQVQACLEQLLPISAKRYVVVV